MGVECDGTCAEPGLNLRIPRKKEQRMEATRLKEEGNRLFQQQEFRQAIDVYTQALRAVGDDSALRATLLSNRSACHLKLGSYKECLVDSEEITSKYDPSHSKALYRTAQAYIGLGDYKNAHIYLLKLLHYDKNNAECIMLLRQVKQRLQVENDTNNGNNTNVGTILKLITASIVGDDYSKVESHINDMKGLLGLLADDAVHAVDFGRKNGVHLFGSIYANRSHNAVQSDVILHVFRIFAAASSHKDFIAKYTCVESNNQLVHLTDQGTYKLNIHSICSILGEHENEVRKTCIYILTNAMKWLPPYHVTQDAQGNSEYSSYLSTDMKSALVRAVTTVVTDVNRSFTDDSSSEVYSLAIDLFASLLSAECMDHFTPPKLIDYRMESLEERKERFQLQNYMKLRSKGYATLGVEDYYLLEHLINSLHHSSLMIRQRASVGINKLVTSYDNDEQIKATILGPKYVSNTGDESCAVTKEKYLFRAELTHALFIARPELGVWFLQQGEPNGVKQLMYLVATNEIKCQEIAAECLCLIASSESGTPLLSPLIPTGAMETLLKSNNTAVASAAASTMTKLSLKAKALQEESPEIAHVMNTATTVLKQQSGKSKVDPNDLSVERAIEVIAAMITKSHIKEEFTHGSYRIAATAVNALLGLPVELYATKRSPVPYGLVYILSALTVTNHELKAIALADKGMTPEQFDKINELQKIKPQEDKETGAVVGDAPEEKDADTTDLCSRRIVKLCSLNIISVLAKVIVLPEVSAAAKELSVRTLRQICVVEKVRGLMMQQGGLKACCAVASDHAVDKKARLEAAHAVSKALISIDPTLLTEHLRMASFSPLLYLCRDGEANNLQQFEALLALTNLVAVGPGEQQKLCSEKGVRDVHYLMFSDHKMVQRAATEVLCNMAVCEDVLSMLRVPDKVRLWLGLCEEYNYASNAQSDESYNIQQDESFLVARAAAGTLAYSLCDPLVAKACVEEGINSTFLHLLQTNNIELLHRALVMILEFICCSTDPDVSVNAEHIKYLQREEKVVIIIKTIQGTKHQLLEPVASEIVAKLSR
jgi:hypothetical protein